MLSQAEKIKRVKNLCEDSTTYADDVYGTYLEVAAQKVLNRRFPFDKCRRQSKIVPDELEMLQIELAVILLLRRGAEGESSHSENGVKRDYRSESEILEDITPLVGVL